MNPIDEYIRAQYVGDGETLVVIGQHVANGLSALNSMADSVEDVGSTLGQMVKGGAMPASAIQPLMKVMPLVQQQHAKLATALTAVQSRCKSGGRILTKGDKGPITPEEREGRIIINQGLFCRAKFAAAKVSASIAGKYAPRGMYLFDRGQENDGDRWGWDANTVLDRSHTNLVKDGQLPTGFWFECMGVSVEVEALDKTEVVPSDLRIFGEASLVWQFSQGQLAIPLTQINRCPPLTTMRQETGSDVTKAVHYAGQPFVQSAPIFRLRDHDKNFGLVVNFPDEDATFSKAYVLTVRLEGVMGVVASGSDR